MARKYMLLRGCLTIGKFNAAGKKIGGVNLHTTEVSVTIDDTMVEHKNTCSAVSTVDARELVDRVVKAKIMVDELNSEIIAMAVGGAVTETASGATFSAKTFPTGLVVGDVVPIPGGYANLDSLTITDSNGTPATLTANTHYKANLGAGTIEILNLASFTQPLKAAGSEADDFDVISLADQGEQERWMVFDAVNVNDGNKKMIVQFHKGSFSPSEVQFKQSGNDYTGFSFEPTLISDPDGDFDTTFGYYGRIIKANA